MQSDSWHLSWTKWGLKTTAEAAGGFYINGGFGYITILWLIYWISFWMYMLVGASLSAKVAFALFAIFRGILNALGKNKP